MRIKSHPHIASFHGAVPSPGGSGLTVPLGEQVGGWRLLSPPPSRTAFTRTSRQLCLSLFGLFNLESHGFFPLQC